MKQTVGIFIFSILLSSVSFAQCPNLTGAWKCTDSDGEKWTEDISMSSPNVYEIVYDKGTPEQEKEVFHADGRVITESVKLKKVTVSMAEKVENFITNYLPRLSQISIISERLKNSEFEPAQLSSSLKITCQNNVATELYSMNMTGQWSSMLQVNANVVGVGKISINKDGKQIRANGETVDVSGQSSVGLVKKSFKPESSKFSSYVICVK